MPKARIAQWAIHVHVCPQRVTTEDDTSNGLDALGKAGRMKVCLVPEFIDNQVVACSLAAPAKFRASVQKASCI